MVAEHVEADGPVADNVDGVQIDRWGAIGDQAPEVLANEAADIDEGLIRMEPCENFSIRRRAGDVGIEEKAQACARVGTYGPGFITLVDRERRLSCSFGSRRFV